MSITTTSDELRQAAEEARSLVIHFVEADPGIPLKRVYTEVAHKGWQEPAVRTAIWDLIAERRILLRKSNKLYPYKD